MNHTRGICGRFNSEAPSCLQDLMNICSARRLPSQYSP
jgi:hypothetical protein